MVVARVDGSNIKIWSAPLSYKPYFDIWDSIQTVENKYGVKYAGWAEDLMSTRVIQVTGDSMADTFVKGIGNSRQVVLTGYNKIANQVPLEKDIQFHLANSTVEQFLNGFLVPLWKTLQAENTVLQQQVTTLNKQLADMTADRDAWKAKAQSSGSVPPIPGDLATVIQEIKTDTTNITNKLNEHFK